MNEQFDPLFPDVLGVIAGSARIHMDALQMAVGVFPRQVYLNQPVEVIIILQNMVDQPMDVKVALQLPTKDGSGKPVNIVTPKKMLAFSLRPAEAGVLRIPVVAMPPTEPGENFPVQVAVRQRVQSKHSNVIRPATGGAPPSVLAVSPFKLHVLRDVEFILHPYTQSPESVRAYFDIAPKKLPNMPKDLKPAYEALWTMEQLREERELARAKLDDARLVASSLTRAHIYYPILHAVDEIYALHGLPLHPGEAKALAKMITYTFDEGAALEQVTKLEDTRWFQTLCQVLAYDPSVAEWEPGDIAVRYLFEAAVFDAVLLAFGLIRPRVRVNLGDKTERVNYASRVIGWLAGQSEPDLTYIYLPLLLGGVTINSVVVGRDEDAWQTLDEIREAYRGRMRLVSGPTMEIFEMLDKLIVRAEDDLRRARILRM
ncbi:MAG TPA: hypothetical protein VK003_10460 [Oceanobacillus sp.]|nr:hypothetical protein [Oceanobacillus sp.]